jgi:Flp pilus assembly pilin Flp
MKNFIKKLSKDERGLSTMEYAVLFVVIIVGAIATWSALGQNMFDQLSEGADTFEENLHPAEG